RFRRALEARRARIALVTDARDERERGARARQSRRANELLADQLIRLATAAAAHAHELGFVVAGPGCGAAPRPFFRRLDESHAEKMAPYTAFAKGCVFGAAMPPLSGR